MKIKKIISIVLMVSLLLLAGCSTDKQISQTTPAETRPAEPETQNTQPEEDYSWLYEESNPDIPIGSTYELGQGVYVVGEDIPAGRYRVEWVSGNQFGGSLKASFDDMFMDTYASIGPDESYTCTIYDEDEFEISLATMRFTKVTVTPNEDYLQPDGSYIFGPGYYFEGVDIPCGKYNVTALSGNQFGLNIQTKDDYINLDIGETYNNLKLENMTYVVEVSLGTVQFVPR